MEFKANEKKNVEIVSGGVTYERHAIPTHFVEIGEDYIELIERYVKPIYEEGWLLSISEKIIALCQKRVVYKKDMKISFLAKFLSRFAMQHNSAGIGVGEVCKMQFAIDHAGAWRVFWAAVCAGFGKLVGKRGVFYDMVGEEVTGLDGFYPDVFPVYGEYGIRLPDDPTGVCNEIYEKTGVKCMIVDANDLTRDILGKCDAVKLSDEALCDIIRDNPAGQSKQLTPFILIREKKEEAREEAPKGKDAALVIMAAGMGSRYGGNKQVDGIGPGGEILMEYSIFDALRAGFTKVVFIIKNDMVDMMKNLVGDRVEAMGAKVEYAVQDFSSVPSFYAIPQERTKPFGTCHAVLCAADVVKEPFCVINADDYYGADAFRTVYKALCEMDETGKGCMVGYRLKNTVSRHGTVSRGVCKAVDGNLTEVVETLKIALEEDGTIRDTVKDEVLDGESIVSMNFWGFTPWIFGKIEDYFHEFLKNLPEGELKAECLLPILVDKLIRGGEMDVAVLHSDAKWFGMTYQEDKPIVAEALRALHDAGEYPKTLR